MRRGLPLPEAERLLRKCVELREQAEPNAESLMLVGPGGLKQREENIPAAHRAATLDEATRRLVLLDEAWGQKEKADEWRKRLGSRP